MNIFYLAHRMPYPPNKGDKIRSFHQIRYLSQEHTVHLACLVDEPEDLPHVKILERYCASVEAVYRSSATAHSLAALALFQEKPLSVASFYSRELQRRIDRQLASTAFDCIVVFSTAMAEYVRHVADIPKVMDFVDVDSEKWRLYADYHPFPISRMYRLEADRLARYEAEVATSFDHSIFVSAGEAQLFQRRVGDQRISVIPNGVDLDYFAPGDASCQAPQPVLTFTGAMDYFPNVDAVRYFCGEIWPLVRKEFPEARFYIVGRHPSRQVREWGPRQNVIVTGAVADVRPYLATADLAVAPLRIARGLQNKVLEAMAMGKPVVGTSHAFQGTQATTADGIRVADDPAAFAAEVLALLASPALRRQYAMQARQYVQRCHRWPEHARTLEALLQQLAGQATPPDGADSLGGHSLADRLH